MALRNEGQEQYVPVSSKDMTEQKLQVSKASVLDFHLLILQT